MANVETGIVAKLRKAHAALLRDLQVLDEATRASSSKAAAALMARLDATRKHIAEQFRFEEEDGYMDTVRKREPRLEHTIQQLSAEHRELAESLRTLLEQARAADPADAGLRKQVRAWVKQVRQHETRENEVVQDAFNRDIGAED